MLFYFNAIWTPKTASSGFWIVLALVVGIFIGVIVGVELSIGSMKGVL